MQHGVPKNGHRAATWLLLCAILAGFVGTLPGCNKESAGRTSTLSSHSKTVEAGHQETFTFSIPLYTEELYPSLLAHTYSLGTGRNNVTALYSFNGTLFHLTVDTGTVEYILYGAADSLIVANGNTVETLPLESYTRQNELWGYWEEAAGLVAARAAGDARTLPPAQPGPEIILYQTVLEIDYASYERVHGFIDRQGNLLLSGYSDAGNFREGLAPVQTEKGWQYINTAGEIQFGGEAFAWAGAFHEGVAGVSYIVEGSGSLVGDYCYAILHSDGTLYPLPRDLSFEAWPSFSHGLAPVRNRLGNDYRFGYVNTQGEPVTGFVYNRVGPFSEGLAYVSTTGYPWSLQYINTDFEIVIDLGEGSGDFSDSAYPFSYSFSEGIATNGRGLYFDKDGNTLFQVGSGLLVASSPFSEGLAAVYVREGGWGYINTNGDWVIEPQFSGAWSFSEGRAAVAPPNGYESDIHYPVGIIDTEGNLVVEYTLHNYYSAGLPIPPLRYENGLLWAYSTLHSSSYIYLDLAGNIVYP